MINDRQWNQNRTFTNVFKDPVKRDISLDLFLLPTSSFSLRNNTHESRENGIILLEQTILHSKYWEGILLYMSNVKTLKAPHQ